MNLAVLRHTKQIKTKKQKTFLRRKNMNPNYWQRRPSRWSGASVACPAKEENNLLKLTTKGYNSLMSWL